MAEHRFSFNDREAALLVNVISHSLRGLPMIFDAESRTYLINIKAALTRRTAGRRPAISLAYGGGVTRLGNEGR